MKGPGDQLLARAGLAVQQHSGVRRSNDRKLVQDFVKCGALPTMSSKLYSALISDSRYKRSSSRRAADAFSRPCASALSNARDIWMLICASRSRCCCPNASALRLPITTKPNGLVSVARQAKATDLIDSAFRGSPRFAGSLLLISSTDQMAARRVCSVCQLRSGQVSGTDLSQEPTCLGKVVPDTFEAGWSPLSRPRT